MSDHKHIPAKEYETFVLDGVEYQTYTTKKYNQRKPYQPINHGLILAFIPGSIIEVMVKVGDKVKLGDTLVVLEAKKMLNQLKAPFNGVVTKLNMTVGEKVVKSQILVELQPEIVDSDE